MNEFTDLTTNSPPKKREDNYVQTFNINDKVCLKTNKLKYSKEYIKFGKNIAIVEKCVLADLGDMKVECLYLQENDNIEINNPYIASHFNKVIIENEN